MTERRETSWGTAVHEAGHAVASFLLGRGVLRATIEPEAGVLGRVEHTPPGDWLGDALDEANYDASWGGFVKARTRRHVETTAMVLLAGGLAEQTILGVEDTDTGAGLYAAPPDEAANLARVCGGEPDEYRRLIGRGDWREVMDILYQVSSSDEEAAAYSGWLLERTRNLIRHLAFRPAVERVAAELIAKRTLSGAELRRLYREVRREAHEQVRAGIALE